MACFFFCQARQPFFRCCRTLLLQYTVKNATYSRRVFRCPNKGFLFLYFPAGNRALPCTLFDSRRDELTSSSFFFFFFQARQSYFRCGLYTTAVHAVPCSSQRVFRGTSLWVVTFVWSRTKASYPLRLHGSAVHTEARRRPRRVSVAFCSLLILCYLDRQPLFR